MTCCWHEFDAICVCPLIDHGQQPMKMHTEVMLLYKIKYTTMETLNTEIIPDDDLTKLNVLYFIRG